MLAGNVSLTATPLRAVPAFGLVMVSVRDDVPLTGIDVGLNDFAIDGGPITVMFAVPVLPVPALVELTLPVVLVSEPDVVPVTLSVIVHVPPAATLPPLKLTLPVP